MQFNPMWLITYQNGIIKSLQSLRFSSFIVTLQYHLHTCRTEVYYECDWIGARIIVIYSLTNQKKSRA